MPTGDEETKNRALRASDANTPDHGKRRKHLQAFLLNLRFHMIRTHHITQRGRGLRREVKLELERGLLVMSPSTSPVAATGSTAALARAVVRCEAIDSERVQCPQRCALYRYW